jgi:hypothetical protein
LYRPRGAPLAGYRAEQLQVGAPAGELRLVIAAGEITMHYRIGEESGQKKLVPQPF